MQLAAFEFGTSQLIVNDLDIIELMLFLQMAFIETVTIVEHVVGRQDEQQDDK